MPSAPTKRLLFLDQGMLKDRHGKPIHGVELFRLLLIQQLIDRGYEVTMGVDRSWGKIIDERFAEGSRPRLICPPRPFTGTVMNSVAAVAMASKLEPYDAVVFGDPRKGLRPAMKLAHRLNIGKRYLVFSHRHQTKKTAKDIASIGDPVLAVSEDVAKGYRDAGVNELGIMYGLPNTEAFVPPREPVKNEKTRFILLGRLPNPAKGLDTALDAWSMLDADLRAKCELHLVSFIEPTDLQVEGVVVHRWTPQWEIPELLRTMDVMLAVSNNETFSQAIVQGMLTGLPIIATPLPVYTEKMDTGGGIVCDSSEKVARAMAELAQDPDRQALMGAIGRQTALDRYVWDTDVFIRRYLFPVGKFGADE